MSDSMRQSTTDKIGSSMKPDSQKSTMESVGDKAKGAMDGVAKRAEPESEKSMTQKASDSVTGGSSDASKEGGSMLDSAKDALGMGNK